MSGPPPKKDRRSKGALPYLLAQLPKEGRKGPAPAWPLEGGAPRGWAELWRCPQAVQWEKMGSFLAVARYLRLRNLIEDLESAEAMKPAWFSELRQTEDALGLTPKGMLNLRWQIAGADDAVEGDGKLSAAVSISDRRKRMRIVDEGAG